MKGTLTPGQGLQAFDLLLEYHDPTDCEVNRCRVCKFLISVEPDLLHPDDPRKELRPKPRINI